MIAPAMVGDALLLARFAALPDSLRAALASEAARLGRALLRRAGRRVAAGGLSLAVESTADAVTAIIATGSGVAGRPPRSVTPKPRRASAAPRRPQPHGFRPALDAAFVAMGPEIRAGLEMSVRRAFVR
jgi:hypothetical protein